MKNKKTTHWDLASALILFSILVFTGLRFNATSWAEGLSVVMLLVLIGVPLGLALGYSRFNPWIVFFLALGYTLFVIPWSLGIELYGQISWLEKLSSMWGRMAVSLDLYFKKEAVEDTFLFLVVTSLIFWMISITAGYQWARKENVVGALLPTWSTLLLIQVYDGTHTSRLFFLFLALFLSLLLLGRRQVLQKRRQWKKDRVRITSETSSQINMILALSAAAIILLAWLLPVPFQPPYYARLVWAQVSKPWQEARKNLGNVAAGLEGSSSNTSYDFYSSDQLQLGQRAVTGNDPIFSVELPPDLEANHHYWRVRVYDIYTNGQWQNSAAPRTMIGPNRASLDLPDLSGDVQTGEYTFRVFQSNIQNLFTPILTTQVSRPAEVSYFWAGSGFEDPLLVRTDFPIHAGESYHTEAIDSNPTILDLRTAGELYPGWIIDHYLQVPSNLSDEVKALAEQLTENSSTPYDKAVAVTNYLRREITYSKTVARPPFGADVIKWFLLDYKRGYCNYYASAEVILLRSVGIPARMAVGFAEGDTVTGQEQMRTIRLKDAHAWPEVYFPGVGWVEFEPTVIQSTIIRPTGVIATLNNPTPAAQAIPDIFDETPASQAPFATPIPEETETPVMVPMQEQVPSSFYLFFGLLIVGLSSILIWRNRKRRKSIPIPFPVRITNVLERNSIQVPDWLKRWSERINVPAIQRYFSVIHRSLRWLGSPSNPSDTPMISCDQLLNILPEAAEEIVQLREEYQKFLFSREFINEKLAQESSHLIRRKAFKASLIRLIQRLKNALTLRRFRKKD
jgi:transglutaminase-like putative cysteine protease